MAMLTRGVPVREKATLYLHFPCFDGLVSGVLTRELLEQQGWVFEHFCPVNYEVREEWLSRPLNIPCAVVDFLYHTDADFWADHHLTAFVTEAARNDFARRSSPHFVYDSSSGSCASLIWRRFSPGFEADARHKELVVWADKIDAARYSSVEEALFGDAPALRISFSLMRRCDSDYCSFLLNALGTMTLDRVADLPEVRTRYDEVRSLTTAGLQRFRMAARLEGDVVIFDIQAGNDIVSRYAPYAVYPTARYSLGVIRYPQTAKILAMRNPWLEFPSVPLGPLFAAFGGGGHERVGAVTLSQDRMGDADTILRELRDRICAADRTSVCA